PTAEVPVRVPAGSLYKEQDPFKDKPGEDFGFEFSEDFKDTSVKKRSNPWKKLLYLVTSLIPVGLIFSALTPNVINIQPTGSEGQYPSTGNFVRRRADGTVHPDSPPGSISPPAHFTPPRPPNRAVPPSQIIPPISERCRRRLLCELQNDVYYAARSSRHKRQCHRIPCEDPTALSSTLNYLINYQQAASAAFQQRLQSSGDTLNIADHFT
ncbi:uncharacterized protein LOC113233701, partial [Hyposmocoma kahamanoa]|uniref:uncharacterized protein LOC113233701 n=1 Tax=Hyposmocoma kahamanoa TaxID=1477025 RepID=UPI000E6D81C9